MSQGQKITGSMCTGGPVCSCYMPYSYVSEYSFKAWHDSSIVECWAALLFKYEFSHTLCLPHIISFKRVSLTYYVSHTLLSLAYYIFHTLLIACMHVRMYMRLLLYTCVCVYVYMPVYVSICLTVYLFACPSFHLSICPSARLCVCVFTCIQIVTGESRSVDVRYCVCVCVWCGY